MAGTSKKSPLPAWQWVMDKAGWQTVAEMSRAVRLNDSACRDYVYLGKLPSIDNAARIARAAGIDLGELADRLTPRLSA